MTVDEILQADTDESFIQIMQIKADSPHGNIFAQHMREACIMSHFKYGNVKDKPFTHYKMLSGFEVAAFEKDGNHEHLVNIANYAMFRYMTGEGTIDVWDTAIEALQQYDPTQHIGTDSDKSVVKHRSKPKPVTEHLRDLILKDI